MIVLKAERTTDNRSARTILLLALVFGKFTFFDDVYCQTLSKDEATTERAKVFQDLGWDHLVEGDKKWAVLGHPKSFALF